MGKRVKGCVHMCVCMHMGSQLWVYECIDWCSQVGKFIKETGMLIGKLPGKQNRSLNLAAESQVGSWPELVITPHEMTLLCYVPGGSAATQGTVCPPTWS